MDNGTTKALTANGIINYYKPTGISSRAAVNDVIRTSGIRRLKAGHAGTLDPIAEGVLLVCIGKATRLIPYIHQLPKEYIGTFRFGVESDSDDIETPARAIPNAVFPSRE